MNKEIYYSKRPWREVRAFHDSNIIRVYQAFNNEIAVNALSNGFFSDPFKFEGITSWIKPSFLWCMKRTGWGHYTKNEKTKFGEFRDQGSTTVLGVDIPYEFFIECLNNAVVTNYEDLLTPNRNKWSEQFQKATVVVQWDPEKNINGGKRGYKSIQIGLRSPYLMKYSQSIIHIEDMSPLINEIVNTDNIEQKITLLPKETPVTLSEQIQDMLRMNIK